MHVGSLSSQVHLLKRATRLVFSSLQRASLISVHLRKACFPCTSASYRPGLNAESSSTGGRWSGLGDEPREVDLNNIYSNSDFVM